MATHSNPREARRRDSKSLRNLRIALVLTFVYMLAEAVGGWLTNSLALLAEAGHMLADAAAMSLTLAAIWFAERPATPNKTYGYYRLEILAAFINGVALAVIFLWVIWEAYSRWLVPHEIMGAGLTVVAVGGLIVNLIAAGLLHGNHKHDLNMRGAWLHVMGDALGSVAAISAGLAILIFGWAWADALASVLISVIIIFGAWKLIKDSVNVLLEGTPSHINLTAVEESLEDLPGVTDVHDLHVWTITSGMEALSVHIVHDGAKPQNDMLKEVRDLIHDEFGIEHLTVQIEREAEEGEAERSCISGASCFGPAPAVSRGQRPVSFE
ncbi:MAG TPA: cation diffusion facilitator family transporter [Aridibacter sp.]|nr:cation diffusion facilitator family transporter [Aridibacter sp.]